MNQQNTVNIPLRYPVRLADGLLTSVTMRRPNAGDLIKTPVRSANDVEGELAQLAALIGMVPEDVMLLDLVDYDAIREQYIFFRTEKKPDPDAAKRAAANPSGALQSGNGAGHDGAGTGHVAG